MMMLIMIVTGCGSEKKDSKELIDPNASSLTLQVDEIIDDRYVVQIPQFISEINSETINDINYDIDNLLVDMYERLSESKDKTPEIRLITSESEKYLQVVAMYVDYPLVGSDGDVVSYNYVRDEDIRLYMSDALIRAGITLDDLKNKIIEEYYLINEEIADNITVHGATVDGFIIEENDVIFYGNINVSEEDIDHWSYIFEYSFNEEKLRIIEE